MCGAEIGFEPLCISDSNWPQALLSFAKLELTHVGSQRWRDLLREPIESNSDSLESVMRKAKGRQELWLARSFLLYCGGKAT
jgi:hypothetical protein